MYFLVLLVLSSITEGVARDTFHDFSSTCDNVTKKLFQQKVGHFKKQGWPWRWSEKKIFWKL